MKTFKILSAVFLVGAVYGCNPPKAIEDPVEVVPEDVYIADSELVENVILEPVDKEDVAF